MTRQQLLLPHPWTCLCYQQYLKYRGGPSTATVQWWQPYYVGDSISKLQIQVAS
jgi:hypothetical protein